MKYRAPSPEAVYEEAIAQTRDPRKVFQLFHSAPMLKHACLNLAAYILDVVPTRSGDKPLIHEAMNRAWAEYCEVNGGAGAHLKRLRAFTVGLLSATSDVAESRVLVRIGNNPLGWDPGPVTLSEWLKPLVGHQPEVTFEQWTALTEETAILLVAARILPWPHITALGGDIGELARQAAMLREHA